MDMLPCQQLRIEHGDVANASLYAIYRTIKYDVFVTEQHWTALDPGDGSGLAAIDQFDAASHYWIARLTEDTPIGILRGSCLRNGFPHGELFARHAQSPAWNASFASLATLNALAVLAAFRNQRFSLAGRGGSGTAATLLMLTAMQALEQGGMLGVVASVGNPVSLRLCRALGFLVIDPPQRLSHAPVDALLNVGLVFGSARHEAAERRAGMSVARGEMVAAARALDHYFARIDHPAEGHGDAIA
jgi:hypothetical protein